jgi:hypothetical protein
MEAATGIGELTGTWQDTAISSSPCAARGSRAALAARILRAGFGCVPNGMPYSGGWRTIARGTR